MKANHRKRKLTYIGNTDQSVRWMVDIQYALISKYYRTVNQRGFPIYFYKGTEGLVIQAFDKSLYFCVDEKVFALEEIPEHELSSRNFNFKEPSKKPCVKYIPPMSHPWKKSSFEQFKRKQAHRVELMTGS